MEPRRPAHRKRFPSLCERGKFPVKRGFLLIASGVLFNCTSLFGQNSPSETPPASVAQPSMTPSGSEHGIYVSGFELLSKSNGQDLGFYPDRILTAVRGTWYRRIPELQKSTELKRGTTVIEFAIREDGSLETMKTVESAGSDSLDDAAKQAITSAAPFARLPDAYREKALKLRMHFGYKQPTSPEAPVCDGPNLGAHPADGGVIHHVGDGVKPPRATHSPDPEYSEQARRAKYQGIVMVGGTVDPDGAFTDLCVAQGVGAGLDEKAIEAVGSWKFEPGTLQGQPVAVRIGVEVSFRLY